MKILLWALQFILGLHTLMGALWKFSNTEQSVSSLSALPHGLWLGLGVLDLLCSIVLILPLFTKSWGQLAPFAAMVVAAEMLLFAGLHLRSGSPQQAHLVYWLIVAIVCGLLAAGRLSVKTA